MIQSEAVSLLRTLGIEHRIVSQSLTMAREYCEIFDAVQSAVEDLKLKRKVRLCGDLQSLICDLRDEIERLRKITERPTVLVPAGTVVFNGPNPIGILKEDYPNPSGQLNIVTKAGSERIKEQPDGSVEIDTRKSWEVARDDVLKVFPDARVCQGLAHIGSNMLIVVYGPRDSSKWTQLGWSNVKKDGAWLSAKMDLDIKIREGSIVPPPRQPSPVSVWSREIPQEAGWYWIRRLEIGEKPHIIEVKKPHHGDQVFVENGQEFHFSGVMPRFEFGPRIPEPPV